MSRRIAALIVTGESLGALVKAGKRFIDVSSPVPDTAVFFTSYFDHGSNAFVVVFEDESFDLVPEGRSIPFLVEPCEVTQRGEMALSD